MEVFKLQDFLDRKVDEYNQLGFIENDPICIPHLFSDKPNQEIMGFIASILAWGQRKTIISKCKELIDRMDGDPHSFILGHSESDLKSLLGFKHRTFNDTDLLYFVHFFRHHYSDHESLETAFTKGQIGPINIEVSLNRFKEYFFSLEDAPHRTRKHVSSPMQKSACKRLNMFLRWMVRKDDRGVDFGLWPTISPSQLVAPCDVHVNRVAFKLGLIKEIKSDWKTAVELTNQFLLLDPEDPIKYDFALFGLGVSNEL